MRSSFWRTIICRSTDSRRARNSASVIPCRRRPEARDSRRRWRLASRRVEPFTEVTASAEVDSTMRGVRTLVTVLGSSSSSTSSRSVSPRRRRRRLRATTSPSSCGSSSAASSSAFSCCFFARAAAFSSSMSGALNSTEVAPNGSAATSGTEEAAGAVSASSPRGAAPSFWVLIVCGCSCGAAAEPCRTRSAAADGGRSAPRPEAGGTSRKSSGCPAPSLQPWHRPAIRPRRGSSPRGPRWVGRWSRRAPQSHGSLARVVFARALAGSAARRCTTPVGGTSDRRRPRAARPSASPSIAHPRRGREGRGPGACRTHPGDARSTPLR
ncbi:Uncharacterised protein [Mycobacteroides abscessus subsp. abscessus]|nr:Uncharacterised protein [Mycobacteroides abscessus subsp. abscessus]